MVCALVRLSEVLLSSLLCSCSERERVCGANFTERGRRRDAAV